MKRSCRRAVLWGILGIIGLVVPLTWAQAATSTPTPPPSAKSKLERLGKTWAITLRKGVKFHGNWGEVSAKDVRHAVFLISQPESMQSDAGTWRTLMGVEATDTIETVVKKVEAGVQIIDDHQVVFRLRSVAPEFVELISANTDLMMESKARWDAEGKELYGQKVVGTGPFELVERKVGSHVLYKRVENPWRKTPEYKELEFRWLAAVNPKYMGEYVFPGVITGHYTHLEYIKLAP